MGASESSEQPPSEGGPLLGREVELGQETTAEHDGGYTDDGVPRDDQDHELLRRPNHNSVPRAQILQLWCNSVLSDRRPM
eukprot:3465242-Amphidinium_carterae.3